eukprot:1296414-Alexandrium_andersonii.AAC.1
MRGAGLGWVLVRLSGVGLLWRRGALATGSKGTAPGRVREMGAPVSPQRSVASMREQPGVVGIWASGFTVCQ